MTSAGSHNKPNPMSQGLKLLIEFAPLAAFFAANYFRGLIWATGVLMVATVISLIVSRVLFGRIPIMPLVTGVCVMIFGGLTLYFDNNYFIKLKPTIVNGLFATVLLGGLAFNWIALKVLFGEVFALAEEGWRKLQLRWGLFFVFLAGLNEIVWRNFSDNAWASFKAFGIMPLTLIFALSQVGVLMRYGQEQSPGGGNAATADGGTDIDDARRS